MATVIAALAGTLIFNPQKDVESDANPALQSGVFVQVARAGAAGGALSFEIPSAYGGTVSLAGTPANGNTVTVTINGVATVYTVSGSPSLATVAAGIAAAINANGSINGLVNASSNGSVVYLYTLAGGAVGAYTLTVANSGAVVPTASGANLTLFGHLTTGAACVVTVSQ